MMKWLDARPGCDMSFAEYLAANPTDPASAAAAANYVEGFNAADRNRIGIASLAVQQRAEDVIDGDRIFHLAEGYDSLLEFPCGTVPRRRRRARARRARAAHRMAARQRARSARQRWPQWRGARALITVPLGVLQRAIAIDFAPRADRDPRARTAPRHGRCLESRTPVSRSLLARSPRTRFPRACSASSPISAFFSHPPRYPRPGGPPIPTTRRCSSAGSAAPRRPISGARSRRAATPRRCRAGASRRSRVCSAADRGARSSARQLSRARLVADPYARGAYSYVPAGALDAPAKLTVPGR